MGKINAMALARAHGIGMPNVPPQGVVYGPIAFNGSIASATPGTLDLTTNTSWSTDYEMSRVYPNSTPDAVLLANKVLVVIDGSNLTGDQLMALKQTLRLNINRTGDERKVNLFRAIQTAAVARDGASTERATTQYRAFLKLPFRFAVDMSQDTLQVEWGGPTLGGAVNFQIFFGGIIVPKSVGQPIINMDKDCKPSPQLEQTVADERLQQTLAPPWAQ